MSADLAAAALQFGCSWLISANRPARCGLDIEVPAMAMNSSSGTEPASGNGELPARIWMPGAVMSGLMMSSATGFGPREEKSVIVGAFAHVDSAPVAIVAVAGLFFGAEAMYDLIASPGVLSTWTVGTQCVSLNRFPASLFSYMIMPTPPAWTTASL